MTTTPTGRRPGTATTELLGGAPGATALVEGDRSWTYAELAHEVRRTAAEIGSTRRLVLLEAANDARTVITFLAALEGRHPVLLVGAGDRARAAEIHATYRPDVVADHRGTRQVSDPDAAAHDLHDDLALLLSTSGSTGSPKLVRLSRDNVLANARSIADYLHIRDDDRAVTSLPLHYCYGLSVLTSHLVSGAAVVLTDLSVTDECFWDLVREHGVSSLAGVPHTFELLASSGFADRDLPSLRFVTQAGGRLAPDAVTRFSQLGRSRGWDLVVMYGQTEATARMAYLPPDLAATRPTAVGIPIPGGSIRLEPVAGLDPTTGELVYSGPNVMMGYAEGPGALARGPELAELRTGDLGRRGADGLWEVVGRVDRHAKLFGLRLDLELLERRLAPPTSLVVHGDRLHAFATDRRARASARQALPALAGIPASAVVVHHLERLPVTASGKTDHAALTRHAAASAELPPAAPTPAVATAESLRDMYAVLLGRPDAVLDDTFVTLGGDSLSFVEVSTRLGQSLGHLPPGWQHRSIRALAGDARPRRRFTAPVEMSIVLRSVAILLILVTHTDIVLVPGGAHVLLAVFGFNLARFAITVPGRRERTRRLLMAAAGVAVPAVLWIGGCVVLADAYRPTTALLLNGALGGDGWSDDWQYWFLEAVVWTTVALAGLLAWAPMDRWQRRHRFAFPALLVLAAVALRYAWTGVEAGATERYSVPLVLWAIALGWAAAEARTHLHRVVVLALTAGAAYGFFGDLQRETLVFVGIALLLCARPLLLPAPLARLTQVVAGASLWIYLTHWLVYPDLEAAGHPVFGVIASIGVGVVAWWLHRRAARLVVTAAPRPHSSRSF